MIQQRQPHPFDQVLLVLYSSLDLAELVQTYTVRRQRRLDGQIVVGLHRRIDGNIQVDLRFRHLCRSLFLLDILNHLRLRPVDKLKPEDEAQSQTPNRDRSPMLHCRTPSISPRPGRILPVRSPIRGKHPLEIGSG